VDFPIELVPKPPPMCSYIDGKHKVYQLDMNIAHVRSTEEIRDFLNGDFMSITDDQWSSVILHMRTTGSIGVIRSFLRLLYKEATEQFKSQSGDTPLDDRVDHFISQRNVEPVVDQKLLHYMRTFTETADVGPRDVLRRVQGLQAKTTESESQGWTLGDVVPNRLRRAPDATVYSKKDRDKYVLDVPIHQVECDVCCEIGNGVVVFGDPLLGDHITDHINTFPLAYGQLGAGVMVALTMCACCAEYFELRGRGPFRSGVSGSLILTEEIDDNQWASVYSLASKVFGLGKRVPYVSMLLYASLEHSLTMTWLHPSLRLAIRGFMGAMESRILTTATFLDDFSTKVTIRSAFENVITNIDLFLSFPTQMQILITRRVSGKTGLSRITLYMDIIRSIAMNIKRGSYNMMRTKFYECVFDVFHGLVISGTPHMITINHLRDIFDIPSNLIDHVNEHKDTPSDNEITCFIYTCIALCDKQQARFMNAKPHGIIQELKNVPLIKDCLTSTSVESSILVQDSIDALRHALDGVEPDPLHTTAPPFELLIGKYSVPNPLTCACGYSFLPRGRYTLDQATTMVKTNKHTHFTQVYGSENPGPETAHFNLHKSIAEMFFMESKGSDIHESDIHEITQGVCERLMSSARGNIHHSRVPPMIQNTVLSLIALQNRSENYYNTEQDRICRSLRFKIALALYQRQVIPTYMVSWSDMFDYDPILHVVNIP
jgi:hypothetical protein